MTDTPQEIMTRAICKQDGEEQDDSLQFSETEKIWTLYTPAAQAAISALKEAGYVICPIEPTEAMIEAGRAALIEWYEGTGDFNSVRDIITAAIQASTPED